MCVGRQGQLFICPIASWRFYSDLVLKDCNFLTVGIIERSNRPPVEIFCALF